MRGETMRITNWFASALLATGLAATGCTGAKMAHNLPPAQQLMEPGPGVGGPGPGVIPVPGQGGMNPGMGMGAMQAAYVGDGGCYGGPGGMAGMGAGMGMGMTAPTSQISFLGEEPLQISWDVSQPGGFDSTPLLVPGKQDFAQGAIYRLRVSNLPGRESVVLYPTLEVAPVTPRTDAYLAHAPIPVQFTEEDFDQVLSGNFVTKVVYLPDPEFTEIALAGVETLVSTRLDPGVDPIAEADRMGSILAILRMGNKDLSTSAGMMGGGMMGGGPGGVVPADFRGGVPTEAAPGEYGENYGPSEGYPVEPAPRYGEPTAGCYGGMGAYASNMPMGAPTAGNVPANLPPHMIPNMAPHYGMPITGTPIGLPGPPHIPLGAPAGLQKHVMKNRTRIDLPPPTDKVKLSVKQRPGMNYPRPAISAHIDEVNRAPAQVFGSTTPGLVPSALSRTWNKLRTAGHGAECTCEHCY